MAKEARATKQIEEENLSKNSSTEDGIEKFQMSNHMNEVRFTSQEENFLPLDNKAGKPRASKTPHQYKTIIKESEKKALEQAKLQKELEETLRREQEEKERILQTVEQEKKNIENRIRELELKCLEAEKSKMKHSEETGKLENILGLQEEQLQVLKTELEKSEANRMFALSQLQEFRGKLRVYCRLKPISNNDERVVFLKDKSTCKELLFQNDQSKKAKSTPFLFDHVFGEKCQQDKVFEEIIPFVQSCLDGKNVSIFAYGPTGTGKTHTLEGVNTCKEGLSDTSGIMPRALDLILGTIDKKNKLAAQDEEMEVSLSCLEIYNEKLGDLLAKKESKEEVQILTKGERVVLEGIVKRKISSMEEANLAIKHSSERRQVESTVHNSRSSRSHSIYRITITKKASEEEEGLLNIIDMAGSEKNALSLEKPSNHNSFQAGITGGVSRQKHMDPEKAKKIQKEANFINKSLTTLGRIIRLIKQQRSFNLKDVVIPYRESKLTRMLQDCIGGEAQTLMIVNVNPGAASLQQTKDTLNFAAIASL